MILYCCNNKKMQDQNLVEINSCVEVSSQSLLKPLSAETCAIPLCENSSGADVNHLNQTGNLDEGLELEKVQKTLPTKCVDGRVYEALLEGPPDTSMGESSSTWGDFEGFSEVKLENLSTTLEPLETLNEKQMYTNEVDVNDNCPTTSCRHLCSKTTGHNRSETLANVSVKAVLSSEDIIKQSFPEVPVPQFLEKISSLDQVLYTKTEDADVPECTKKQICTGSGNLWKTLTHSSNPSSLRRPWSESHYQDNLLAVLGIDAHRKALPEIKNILEKTNIRENEDSIVDKFNISTCKALIQTKLSVSPAPRQSHLFSYNLFLKKTPSGGNMQYITVPQKKRIFTTQSLKMKMFSSNVC
ncbi:uncharacterized protein CLBA1 isoform X2 [Rhineura floridana]|uniref:uncharacterized protein CLBA1 isoform X2 n=1 Tax=Rhineura floridana TaxID=261503 RepID=UPI002AC81ADE|nr:uncharacterized protein CLBA1 isoform X2 [Rhineura floridana]